MTMRYNNPDVFYESDNMEKRKEILSNNSKKLYEVIKKTLGYKLHDSEILAICEISQDLNYTGLWITEKIGKTDRHYAQFKEIIDIFK